MVKPSVDAYLAQRKSKAGPAAAELWSSLETFYANKQWHQLTVAIKTNLQNPVFTKDLDLMQFYNEFIADFESRMNILSLVQILGPILNAVEAKKSVQFLEDLKKRLSKELGSANVKTGVDNQALVLVNSYLVTRKLQIKDAQKKVVDIGEIRNLVEETAKLVEELSGVTAVHGDFHKAYAAYLCEVAEHGGYYREALRYLGCVSLSDMSEAEQKLLAQRLCLSALLSKDVYNFGELLDHPILNILQNSPESWLLDLVKIFNKGDLTAFRAAEKDWGKAWDIKSNEANLLGKLRLLAILDAAFQKQIGDRNLSFVELASRLAVKEEEVELFVMRALSRNLVKGEIDQVARIVHITWIMPRVLDKVLIKEMQDRIKDWAKDVQATSSFIAAHAKDIMVK